MKREEGGKVARGVEKHLVAAPVQVLSAFQLASEVPAMF